MPWPADGMSTPTPSAMSGRTPIVTNSVVPIAKPPRASAPMATTILAVLRDGRWSVDGGALTPSAKRPLPAGRHPGSVRRHGVVVGNGQLPGPHDQHEDDDRQPERGD